MALFEYQYVTKRSHLTRLHPSGRSLIICSRVLLRGSNFICFSVRLCSLHCLATRILIDLLYSSSSGITNLAYAYKKHVTTSYTRFEIIGQKNQKYREHITYPNNLYDCRFIHVAHVMPTIFSYWAKSLNLCQMAEVLNQ